MPPNILFLMTDQMQGRVLEPGHPCLTPNLDRLAARGVRVRGAYAPNPVCSPSRASLMTGLLPHNHGVTDVTHCLDDDQGCLRLQHPHWAQRLQAAGYHTGYFGKWHVERSQDLARFGWTVDGPRLAAAQPSVAPAKPATPVRVLKKRTLPTPGYRDGLVYEVNDRPTSERTLGKVCAQAQSFLSEALAGQSPWCCFVSVIEPHDPFVCNEAYYRRYDPASLVLPENFDDDLRDKPGLYRKCAALFAGLSDAEKREAMACYYAMISEIDHEYGKLLDQVAAAGQLDNTLIVFTSDHGEHLGAHGLYQKNVGAFEEAFVIPMVLAGPGIVPDAAPTARVGLHDLCQTLLELTGNTPFAVPDSRSFASLLRDPAGAAREFQTGYAEYEGTRYKRTQRVAWNGDWKLVWNGFDDDELYNLADDPGEMVNRRHDPTCRAELAAAMALAWRRVRDTQDKALLNASYPCLRLAPIGPGILDQHA